MSATPSRSRALLCSFTYANGQHCRMPRNTTHPFVCTYHARKEAKPQPPTRVGYDLADRFSDHYLAGSDLSSALGHLMSAGVRGQLKPRAASTLAYLSQTLLQAIHLSQHEYINAHGTEPWREEIRDAFAQTDPGSASNDSESDPDPLADPRISTASRRPSNLCRISYLQKSIKQMISSGFKVIALQNKTVGEYSNSRMPSDCSAASCPLLLYVNYLARSL